MRSSSPLYIILTFVGLSSVVAVPNPMQADSMSESCFAVFTLLQLAKSFPSRVMRWAGDFVRDLHRQSPECQSPAYLLRVSEQISFA
jgi:hypothetical protein